jgi:hypothetical protein
MSRGRPAVNDQTIIDRIAALVQREHELREARESGSLDRDAELSELRETEVALDQCWDLLRQRRARREFGQDAAEAEVRPATVVEGYLS